MPGWRWPSPLINLWHRQGQWGMPQVSWGVIITILYKKYWQFSFSSLRKIHAARRTIFVLSRWCHPSSQEDVQDTLGRAQDNIAKARLQGVVAGTH